MCICLRMLGVCMYVFMYVRLMNVCMLDEFTLMYVRCVYACMLGVCMHVFMYVRWMDVC